MRLLRLKQEARFSHTRLRHGFSWLLVGNLVYAATQYLVLVGLVKLTNPEMVGVFSFALAVNAPINLLMSLGLRAVLISDADQRYSFSQYWAVRVWTSLSSIFVVFLVTQLASFSFFETKTIVIISLVKAFESCIDMGYGLWQKHHRNDQIAFSMLFRGALSCLIFNLLLWKTSQLDVACLGLLMSTVIIGVFHDIPRWRKYAGENFSLKLRHQPNEFIAYRNLLFLSMPLGVAAVLSSLESNLPRYFIEHSLDMKALGIFAALSYPLMLGNQVVGALAAAPGPRLATMTVTNEFKGFRQLLFKLALAGALIGIVNSLVCYFWGTEILTLINNSEYAQESKSFFILAVAAGFSYITAFFGAGISALRKFRTKMILQGLGFVIHFAFLTWAAQDASLIKMSLALLLGAILSCLLQLMALLYHERQWRLLRETQ